MQSNIYNPEKLDGIMKIVFTIEDADMMIKTYDLCQI